MKSICKSRYNSDAMVKFVSSDQKLPLGCNLVATQMQLRSNLVATQMELTDNLDSTQMMLQIQFRYSIDCVKILFLVSGWWVAGKIEIKEANSASIGAEIESKLS